MRFAEHRNFPWSVFKPLYYDDIVLLVPESHPLSAKKIAEVEDLEEETILFTPHNCPIRIKIEQTIVEKIGTNYKKLEISSSMAHKHYVQAGLGVSLFTRTAHSFPFPGTKVLDVNGIEAAPVIGLLKRTNNLTGKASTHLLALIEETFSKKHTLQENY